ncbi:hypothetical protein EO036_09545 [Escherichia coli]|nr:hypothetical protein [Escherichia coli]EEX2759954.1 hypothetical protein [Escherichia coli]EEY6114354.1 hypothetical protein [Escherichia coli]EFB2942615.1 hypothetical protein [Escherichia coli]EFC6883576.1 hypothetical protein [Escherichia coli]
MACRSRRTKRQREQCRGYENVAIISSQLLSFLLFCISLLSAAMWIWKSLNDHKNLRKIKAR